MFKNNPIVEIFLNLLTGIDTKWTHSLKQIVGFDTNLLKQWTQSASLSIKGIRYQSYKTKH